MQFVAPFPQQLGPTEPVLLAAARPVGEDRRMTKPVEPADEDTGLRPPESLPELAVQQGVEAGPDLDFLGDHWPVDDDPVEFDAFLCEHRAWRRGTAGPPADRDEAWSAELDRRDDEFDSGGVIGVPAAEVHASARARLRSRSSKP